MTSVTASGTKSKASKYLIIVALTSALIAAGFAWNNQNQSSAAIGKTYDTVSGVKAAKWSPSVSRSYTADYVTVKSDDIPNHERDAYYAVPNAGVIVPNASTAKVMKDPTKAQKLSFKIPLHPQYLDTTTAASLGSIGIMISGSVLFNPYEGDGKTVAMSSNFTIKDSLGNKAYFVDHCSGHPTPDIGQYHYHALSACISKKVDTATGPSHLEGLALDGFPIYGPRDAKGKTVPVANLDKCNGILSPTPEFPKGIYHYVLPQTSNATSSIRCFHGKVDTSQLQQMPPMGPVPGIPR